MNKKRFLNIPLVLFFMLVLFLLFVPCTLMAQTGDVRIAVVDYNKIFSSYSITKSQFIQLSKQKEELEAYIAEKQDEIEKDKKKYNEQEEFYDDSRRREELLKIWVKILEMEIKVDEAKEKIKSTEEAVIKQINASINRAIEKARKDLGYDLVISKQSVFAVDDDIKDITNYVINILAKS